MFNFQEQTPQTLLLYLVETGGFRQTPSFFFWPTFLPVWSKCRTCFTARWGELFRGLIRSWMSQGFNASQKLALQKPTKLSLPQLCMDRDGQTASHIGEKTGVRGGTSRLGLRASWWVFAIIFALSVTVTSTLWALGLGSWCYWRGFLPAHLMVEPLIRFSAEFWPFGDLKCSKYMVKTWL